MKGGNDTPVMGASQVDGLPPGTTVMRAIHV